MAEARKQKPEAYLITWIYTMFITESRTYETSELRKRHPIPNGFMLPEAVAASFTSHSSTTATLVEDEVGTLPTGRICRLEAAGAGLVRGRFVGLFIQISRHRMVLQ